MMKKSLKKVLFILLISFVSAGWLRAADIPVNDLQGNNDLCPVTVVQAGEKPSSGGGAKTDQALAAEDLELGLGMGGASARESAVVEIKENSFHCVKINAGEQKQLYSDNFTQCLGVVCIATKKHESTICIMGHFNKNFQVYSKFLAELTEKQKAERRIQLVLFCWEQTDTFLQENQDVASVDVINSIDRETADLQAKMYKISQKIFPTMLLYRHHMLIQAKMILGIKAALSDDVEIAITPYKTDIPASNKSYIRLGLFCSVDDSTATVYAYLDGLSEFNQRNISICLRDQNFKTLVQQHWGEHVVDSHMTSFKQADLTSGISRLIEQYGTIPVVLQADSLSGENPLLGIKAYVKALYPKLFRLLGPDLVQELYRFSVAD
jgi:hypothetical protein